MMANRRKKPRGTTTQPGYWAAKHALAKFGSHVIDGRSKVARALDQFRDRLLRDLGGSETISEQQRVIVDLTVRTYLMVGSLDNYLLSLGSLVNRKKRTLWPVVRERVALADSLARYMSMLGLDRRVAYELLPTEWRERVKPPEEAGDDPATVEAKGENDAH